MNVSVKELIGSRCIIREDGQKIYDTIFNTLRNREDVTLDFNGVTQFASPFFNFAVGQLLKDISESDLRRLLHLENLNEVGQLVVARVLENASIYHRDKDSQKIVDDILEQQAKDSD